MVHPALAGRFPIVIVDAEGEGKIHSGPEHFARFRENLIDQSLFFVFGVVCFIDEAEIRPTGFIPGRVVVFLFRPVPFFPVCCFCIDKRWFQMGKPFVFLCFVFPI